MADQDYTRDENPHQGPSHSFGRPTGAGAEATAGGSPTTSGTPGSTGTTRPSSSRTRNATTPATPTTSDRERSIAQGRDTSRTNLGRSTGTTPVRGGAYGHGPFTLMRRLSDDMDRLFENLGFGRSFGVGASPVVSGDRDVWGSGSIGNESEWVPQVEAFRRGDKFIVRADLPGIKKEDVHAEVDDGVLTISGERSSEFEDNRDDYYRSERSYGSFFRAIPLPDGVESDNCEATFRDGVLEVSLPAPKQSAATAKQIPIR